MRWNGREGGRICRTGKDETEAGGRQDKKIEPDLKDTTPWGLGGGCVALEVRLGGNGWHDVGRGRTRHCLVIRSCEKCDPETGA